MTNVVCINAARAVNREIIQDNRKSMKGLDPERYVFSELEFAKKYGIEIVDEVPSYEEEIASYNNMFSTEKHLRDQAMWIARIREAENKDL